MFKKILFFFFLFFNFYYSDASVTDTIVSNTIKSDTLKRDSTVFFPVLWTTNFNSLYAVEQKLDTALNILHINNGAFRNSPLQISLGNIGSPTQHLLFEKRRVSDFYFISPYLHYYQLPDEQVYYNVNKPYTNIYFASGPDKEQLVDFVHTQNVFKDLNLGIRLHYFKALGQYDNDEQNSKGNIVNAWAAYESSRYRLKTSYFFGRNEIDENGGLSDYDNFSNSFGVTWNLDGASSKNQYQLFQLYQEWNLLRPRISIDSIVIEYPPYKLALRHKLIYNRADRAFQDKTLTEDFYSYIADTTISVMNERIWGNSISNSLGLIFNGRIKNSTPSFYIDLGVDNEKYSYYDYLKIYPTKDFESIYTQPGICFNSSIVKFSSSFRYFLEGRKKSESFFNMNMLLDLPLGRSKMSLLVTYDINDKYPGVLMSDVQTNTYRWSVDLEKFNENKLKVELHLFKDILAFYFSNSKLTNYTFFNDSVLPEQTSNVNVLTLGAIVHLKLGWLHLDSDVSYQNSSNEEALPLPSFSSNSSLYLMHSFFKKRLLVKLGFDVLYFSKYYSSAYDPIAGVFYNQRNRMLGDYPFSDVFLDLKYKQLRAFIKYTQLYTLVSENVGYFSVVNYPQNRSGIYFGFAWHFYN